MKIYRTYIDGQIDGDGATLLWKR